MANKLIWTARALNEYAKLVAYLLAEWSEAVTLKVISRIKESTLRISRFPEQFPLISKSKKVQQCVITPQTSLFFKVDGDRIVVLSLFDNRQNPKKRNL